MEDHSVMSPDLNITWKVTFFFIVNFFVFCFLFVCLFLFVLVFDCLKQCCCCHVLLHLSLNPEFCWGKNLKKNKKVRKIQNTEKIPLSLVFVRFIVTRTPPSLWSLLTLAWPWKWRNPYLLCVGLPPTLHLKYWQKSVNWFTFSHFAQIAICI